MQNIDSTEALEIVCDTALFSSDIQTKNQAERQLAQFVLQLPPDHLKEVFEQCSFNTVIAVASTLSYHVTIVSNMHHHLQTVNSIMKSWFKLESNSFVRLKGETMSNQVINVVLTFIGKALKELYKKPEEKNQVPKWIDSGEQGDKYRLYLHLAFIEQMAFIYNQMSFVGCKTLLKSFEDEIIPSIFAALIPHFFKLSEGVQVLSLNLLQSNMTLNEPQPPNQPPRSQLNHFSECIFKLVSELVSFKYSVNERPIDQIEVCNIKTSFPSYIINKLIQKDFLQALYSILAKLLELKEYNYLNISLDCLQKILQVRFSAIPPKHLQNFLAINVRGVVELLLSLIRQPGNNLDVMGRVIHCSRMLQDLFSYTKPEFLVKSEIHFQSEYKRWVGVIFTLPNLILQNDMVHAEHYVFLSSASMLNQIGQQLQHLKVQQNFSDVTQQGYLSFVHSFFGTFMINNVPIQGGVDFSTMDNFKTKVHKFFQSPMMICSSFYENLFMSINDKWGSLLKDMGHNEYNITNVILLLSCMLEHHSFFDHNINKVFLFQLQNGVYKEQQSLKAIYAIMNQMFAFVDFYAKQHKYRSFQINLALILFFDAWLSRIVKYSEAKIPNGQKIQVLMNDDKLFTVIIQPTGATLNNFIMRNLQSLGRMIPYINQECAEFILKKMHSFISHIKGYHNRAKFKHTEIYSSLLLFLKNLSSTAVNTPSLKWRVLLFKSLSLLCFDDQLQDYRTNIRNSIQLLHPKTNEDLDRILYDLMGICQGIQFSNVFQYFIAKWMIDIPFYALINKLFQRHDKTDKAKDVLHLTYLLIKYRDEEVKRIDDVYTIVRGSLVYWNHYLQLTLGSIERLDLIEELFLIQKCLIEEGHINIATIEDSLPVEQKANLYNFIKLALQQLLQLLPHVQNLPQFQKDFYGLLYSYLSKFQHYLYNHENTSFAECLTNIIYNTMQSIVDKMDHIMNEEYDLVLLNYKLNICKQFFTSVRQASKYNHRPFEYLHITDILAYSEGKVAFFAKVFMLGMHFGKLSQQNLLGNLTSIAFDCSMIYQFSAQKMAEHMGLNQVDFKEFSRILEYLRSNEEREWIFFQLKDWFKNDIHYDDTTGEIPDGY